MKSLLKNFSIALAAMIATMLAGHAMAQQSYTLTNEGRIQNSLVTSARLDGPGSVTAHGEQTAFSTANGYVTAKPGVISIGGEVKGGNTGIAFVVGSGPTAQGMVKGDGWSDGRVFGDVKSVLPYGHVQASIDVEGGMRDPVANGTDLHIRAGLNQDIAAGATYGGRADASGYIVQTPIAGGATLAGHVQDSKTVDGDVYASRVTFNGTVPTGLTAGTAQVNTGMVVIVNADFRDPAH